MCQQHIISVGGDVVKALRQGHPEMSLPFSSSARQGALTRRCKYSMDPDDASSIDSSNDNKRSISSRVTLISYLSFNFNVSQNVVRDSPSGAHRVTGLVSGCRDLRMAWIGVDKITWEIR